MPAGNFLDLWTLGFGRPNFSVSHPEQESDVKQYLYFAAVAAAAVYHAAVGSVLLALTAGAGLALYPVARWYVEREQSAQINSAASVPTRHHLR